MAKTLVIAEKPSVAGDLARSLGKFERNTDYFENEKYVISSAIGHLVELCLPGELDKKRGKWSFANLPIIPDHFALKPIEKTESRFKLLKRLIKRADVTEIVNACDAGREGELIFRYIMDLAGIKKPIRRLWLQSMTQDAIRTAFGKMRDDVEMHPLADAAICRSESDWLVGINGTRAMTAFNSKLGGFQLTPVGRMQTPTLSILAEREEKIRAFKPRTYFELHAEFDVAAGDYRGRWFDEKFKKDGVEEAKAERIWEKEKAEAIRDKCLGKPGIITEETKPSSQAPPLLYDLTTLQREANNRFGFSAGRTLQIAQALYEKYKVLTYPRTDSRYLPEDYLPTVKATLGKITDPSLGRCADKALKNGWVKANRRVFDGSKVSDHHAIIPTGTEPKTLDEAAEKVYRMVTQRFIAVFYPPAQFETSTRITRVEGEAFKSEGKILVQPGWLEVYGREAAGSDDAAHLCPVKAPIAPGAPSAEQAATRAIDLKEDLTKPPARYNEATLLSAMEGAGKTIDDEELRAAMSAKGLGTPATRAAIIEGLIRDGYVNREARDLIVSAKGLSLITLLRGIGIPSLCSAEMTGEWEFKLKEIENGRMDRQQFMEGIRRLTDEMVTKAKGYESDTVEGNFSEIDVKCPKCGEGPFKEDYRTFKCASCGTLVWKTLASRQFTPEEVETLLRDGKIGPLEGFRNKMGRPFSAIVKLGAEGKPEFDFGNDLSDETIDFSVFPVVAKCPICEDGQVRALPSSYVCDKACGKAAKEGFRMGHNILQREIPAEQIVKLCETGKTDLLHKFISKKGRPFSAYLKLENGKVGFEFEERKAPAAGAKKRATRKSPAAKRAA